MVYVRRRRRAVKRSVKRTMSINRKEKRDAGKAVFWAASVLIFLALAAIFVFVYRHYLKDDIMREISEIRERQAALQPEETLSEENTSAAEERKEESAQQAYEALKAHVLSIEPDFEFAEFSGEPTLSPTGDKILDQAYRMAAGYDYDGALELLKSVTGYGNKQEYIDAIAYISAEKSAVSTFSINNNITHVFFHSLIVDPSLAFDPEIAGVKVQDYNEAMTTVREFVAMLEEMYRNNYVLVDIYDVARMETQPDGTEVMTYREIRLPEEKIPFILSVDDTNYYEYMSGHGFPDRLIVTEDGRVQNEMTLTNGEVITGSFDVLPILEDFIEFHPDFAYHNARGMLGITGYNGVLGYRTSDFWYTLDCDYYVDTEANNAYRATEITCPNPDIEADKVKAKKVADAIKALGWRFASHTWGHKRMGEVSMETLVWDSDMWQREVESILGPTDILIFPYGNDIGQSVGWREYEYEGPNERYETLKAYGFDYFLNVDSSVYFMQRTDGYFRQGRRNLDGERMWQAIYADDGYDGFKNRLGDLFSDVHDIIDPLRPVLNDITLTKTAPDVLPSDNSESTAP